MKKKIEDYFSANNSRDEHWDNACAINKGIYAGIAYLLARVSSYHELLELELDENPTGKIYLSESNSSLQNSLEILEFVKDLTSVRASSFESIELKILINGVVKRLSNICQFEISSDFSNFNEQSTYIQGNLFLLQQLLIDLPHILAKENGGKPSKLFMDGRVVKIDNEILKKQKSPLSNCDAACITLSIDNSTPKLDEYSGLFELWKLLKDKDILERVFFVYGATLEHGGDFLGLGNENGLTACSLLFPLQRNQASMYSGKNLEKSELEGNETILLVDDEDIIWDVVIDMLQNMGYTVILAANGRECVEIYKTNLGKIDLVLLDMVMPELNGREAFFELKKVDPNVTVLLSSGYVDEEDARDVLNAGASGFLQKPYRMLDLAERIRNIMDR